MDCRARTGVADTICAGLGIRRHPLFLSFVGTRYLRDRVALVGAFKTEGGGFRALASQGCRIFPEWATLADRGAASIRQPDDAARRCHIVGAAWQARRLDICHGRLV